MTESDTDRWGFSGYRIAYAAKVAPQICCIEIIRPDDMSDEEWTQIVGEIMEEFGDGDVAPTVRAD